MHTKNKNKRGEKGAIHKSQKQWPRRHVDVYGPLICWDDLSTTRGGHSENRIPVKKLVSNSPPDHYTVNVTYQYIIIIYIIYVYTSPHGSNEITWAQQTLI